MTNTESEIDGHEEATPLAYATAYHAPVLCHAVVDGLVTDPTGCYVDGTLGGGGHTAALLDRLAPTGHVIGIDQDEAALAEATRRLQKDAHRFTACLGNFADLDQLLIAQGVDQVHGILLDLGVSSHQIDTPARGFSYQADGPLDMRMTASARTSADGLVNTASLA